MSRESYWSIAQSVSEDKPQKIAQNHWSIEEADFRVSSQLYETVLQTAGE